MKALRSNLLLVLAAFIWGAAFSAQSASTEYIGPFTFNGIRFIIGGIVLIPVVYLTRRKGRAAGSEDTQPGSGGSVSDEASTPKTATPDFKKHLLPGIVCGIILAVASSLQQQGLVLGTSAGKAGFITALYVILVPVFEIFLGKRGTLFTWISAILAVAGMYLLTSITEGGLCMGDFLEILCAIGFTVHIIVIDRMTGSLNGVLISCIQFFSAGILCLPVMFLCETVSFSAILSCMGPILYAGVCSCGIAYTLQIIGQKNTQPVVASLLLSLESVFSVITAWLFLGSTLSSREIAGCAIVFFAIILAQIPVKQKKKNKKSSGVS